jgi:hypothetical protein
VISLEATLETIKYWDRGGRKELRYTKSEVGRTNFVNQTALFSIASS